MLHHQSSNEFSQLNRGCLKTLIDYASYRRSRDDVGKLLCSRQSYNLNSDVELPFARRGYWIMEYQKPKLDPTTWVDEYGDYLFRYAHSRLRDTSAAEDVVQETFMAGIRFRSQYSGEGSERGWLLAVLKRKIIDHVRRAAKQRSVESFEDDNDLSGRLFDENGKWIKGSTPWTDNPANRIESAELWRVVRDCLNHLPQSQADAFVLRVMEDMNTDDICEQLDISPSNLWVRLHRARLGLANCVGSRWFSDQERNSA